MIRRSCRRSPSAGIDAVPAVWSASDVPLDGVRRASWFARAGTITCASISSAPGSTDSSIARVRVLNSPDARALERRQALLVDLTQTGVPTIPTMSSTATSADVARTVAPGRERLAQGRRQARVSASGYETYALDVPFDDRSRASVRVWWRAATCWCSRSPTRFRATASTRSSFIDGAFSHAAIKRAGRGEFRVQTEHGGSARAHDAERIAHRQAAHVLDALPERAALRARRRHRSRRSVSAHGARAHRAESVLAMRAGAANDFVEAIVRRCRLLHDRVGDGARSLRAHRDDRIDPRRAERREVARERMRRQRAPRPRRQR